MDDIPTKAERAKDRASVGCLPESKPEDPRLVPITKKYLACLDALDALEELNKQDRLVFAGKSGEYIGEIEQLKEQNKRLEAERDKLLAGSNELCRDFVVMKDAYDAARELLKNVPHHHRCGYIQGRKRGTFGTPGYSWEELPCNCVVRRIDALLATKSTEE